MFLNTQLGGLNTAFPDACKTPTPAGPVPIPYPNLSQPLTSTSAAWNVLVSGGPSHNMMSTPSLSLGDQPGVAGGLVSQMDMSGTRHMLGSFTCLMGGMPATRMTSMTGQNGTAPNTVGATLVPSQFKVLCLAP